MSSVFLSNVDDYLAPSQACVNPMFAESTTTTTTTASEEEEITQNTVSSNMDNEHSSDKRRDSVEASVVIPRKRRVRRRRPNNNQISIPSSWTAAPSPAKVSMADCLACSGCVTTAETVLIEQHSLDTLKRRIAQGQQQHNMDVAFTISPAVWGDLFRALQVELVDTSSSCTTTTLGNHDCLQPLRNWQRRIVTFLHQTCRASVVLDGSVPLQWSLHEAATEFCEAYHYHQDKHQCATTTTTTTIKPSVIPPQYSMAVSSSQSKLANGVIVTHNTPPPRATLPVLSSSCPALVCLVEKSTPRAVPHLCSTKSPMTAAGVYLKQQHRHSHDNASNALLHVAIMPCHDKKLEASRNDFLHSKEDTSRDVDLVITTSELFSLLQETYREKDASGIRTRLESLTMAPVYESLQEIPLQIKDRKDDETVVFLTTACPRVEKENMNGDVDMEDVSGDAVSPTHRVGASPSDNFFAFGSGGYADCIFRYACWSLFGYKLEEGVVPWTPVQSDARVRSARVAMARKARRDFYQVSLYRHGDGTVSCDKRDEDSVAVLRFATAYGLQTIQRVLQPFGSKTSLGNNTNQSNDFAFDYVEAMACPSGCPNGGGQARASITVAGGAPRETPTETRQRVDETQTFMKKLGGDATANTGRDIPVDKTMMHTRFHAVPPLQHTMGAAAGVAVQDTQW